MAQPSPLSVLSGALKIADKVHIPRDTRTTAVVRWRQHCEAKTIAETEDPDSKPRAFVRASKKLQDLKIIGVWNDRVWVTGQALVGPRDLLRRRCRCCLHKRPRHRRRA
jgi:hypothetical protein